MNKLAKAKGLIKGGNKYEAKQTFCSLGHHHPSGLEASVCEILIVREKSGDIRNLKYQHTIHLGFGIKWKVDWSFEQGNMRLVNTENEETRWIESLAEAKGVDTRDFKLKLRMFKESDLTSPLELWRGTHKRPYLEKMIYPKGAV